MAYILQADGDKEISMTVDDQKTALAAAVAWSGQDRSIIRIVGDGRIYTFEELATAIINDEEPG